MATNGWRFPGARVAVFAKAPVAGRVKTRLARRLGAEAAARAYRAMLRERLLSLADAGLAPLELWAAPHRHPFLNALARRSGAARRVQPQGELGRRMASALAGDGPCVVVGGDCAGLPTSAVAEALQALCAGAEVVVSPAEDGGYTLVGACRPPGVMFRQMPWGSARVMAETRRRLARTGSALRELEPSWDVDDYSDWRRWRRSH